MSSLTLTPPRAPRALQLRLLRFAALLGVLLLWELGARALAGDFLIAAPSEVATYIARNAGLLSRALAITLREAALGFLYGNAAAILLAVTALLWPRTERLIAALALLFFCLPLVATGPILRVLYGPGEGPQITLAAMAVYYTSFVPLLVGLRAAPSTWFDLVRSYGRGRVTELVQVRALVSVPYLVAGLQIAAPAAFLGAMVGEFTGAERGMGVLTIRAMRSLDIPMTWSLATIASLVSICAYGAIGWIGRRFSAAPPALILSPRGTVEIRPRRRVLLGHAGFVLLLIAAILLIWTLSMEAFGLDRFYAKRPGDVWEFLVSGPGAAGHRATLFMALAETLLYTVPGYLVGLLAGAALAAGLVVLPGLAGGVLPLAIALRCVPIVTTAPLLVLALGRGAAGTITIVAVMIFFPTLVACLQGLRQAPGQVLDIFESYGANRWQRLVLAQIPAMLPAFFASARMAVPAAVLAVTTAEWLATGSGIGSLMALTASTSGYAMLWSAIAVLAALSWMAYITVEAVERRVLRIYASEQLAR